METVNEAGALGRKSTQKVTRWAVLCKPLFLGEFQLCVIHGAVALALGLWPRPVSRPLICWERRLPPSPSLTPALILRETAYGTNRAGISWRFISGLSSAEGV